MSPSWTNSWINVLFTSNKFTNNFPSLRLRGRLEKMIRYKTVRKSEGRRKFDVTFLNQPRANQPYGFAWSLPSPPSPFPFITLVRPSGIHSPMAPDGLRPYAFGWACTQALFLSLRLFSHLLPLIPLLFPRALTIKFPPPFSLSPLWTLLQQPARVFSVISLALANENPVWLNLDAFVRTKFNVDHNQRQASIEHCLFHFSAPAQPLQMFCSRFYPPPFILVFSSFLTAITISIFIAFS